MATIWDTFATESRGGSVLVAASSTLPGADAKVAGQRNDNDCREAARVEGVALHDGNRPAEAGSRAGRAGKRRPEDIAPADYHSLRSSARRAASAAHSSTGLPSSATTSSSETVTAFGSRRATYSASASR